MKRKQEMPSVSVSSSGLLVVPVEQVGFERSQDLPSHLTYVRLCTRDILFQARE